MYKGIIRLKKDFNLQIYILNKYISSNLPLNNVLQEGRCFDSFKMLENRLLVLNSEFRKGVRPLRWWAGSAPPGGDRVKASENLGATVVAPVAPVGTSLYIKGAWKGNKIKLVTFQIGYAGHF